MPPFTSTTAKTPSTWFVNPYIFKHSEDSSLPCKLERLFLWCLYLCFNFSHVHILADHFLKCSKSNPCSDDFKYLTFANKDGLSILFIVILSIDTSL